MSRPDTGKSPGNVARPLRAQDTSAERIDPGHQPHSERHAAASPRQGHPSSHLRVLVCPPPQGRASHAPPNSTSSTGQLMRICCFGWGYQATRLAGASFSVRVMVVLVMAIAGGGGRALLDFLFPDFGRTRFVWR